MKCVDIDILRMLFLFLLLIFPLIMILWYRIPLAGKMTVAISRMVLQLLFVGMYLHVIFKENNTWLSLGWFLIMTVVADFSILGHTGLRVKKFFFPLLLAVIVGTVIPMFIFIVLIINAPNFMEARFAIPIGGMLLGNCLRANIIGLKGFYGAVKTNSNHYLLRLSQGATLREALYPYAGEAISSAIQPTLATMATIGLVALPGMMTGLILGGADPMVSIKYQIVIMVSIFSSTAITVWGCLVLTIKSSFQANGLLDMDVFKK